MRPDMFPPDVILVLSKLRADAPAHSGALWPRDARLDFGKHQPRKKGCVSKDVEGPAG